MVHEWCRHQIFRRCPNMRPQMETKQQQRQLEIKLYPNLDIQCGRGCRPWCNLGCRLKDAYFQQCPVIG